VNRRLRDEFQSAKTIVTSCGQEESCLPSFCHGIRTAKDRPHDYWLRPTSAPRGIHSMLRRPRVPRAQTPDFAKGVIPQMPFPPQEQAESPEKRPGQASTSLVDWAVSMSTRQQRVVTTKIFRAGETPPEDDWSGSSVAERIDAVWELTRQCLAWNQTGTDEPRLQRSVSRVQRPQR
jgi:hypothetical protein